VSSLSSALSQCSSITWLTTVIGISPALGAFLAGLILSQIGEFSFILAATGIKYNLLSESTYQIFISLSILTMAVTHFILNSSLFILKYLSKLPVPEKLKTGSYPMSISEKLKLEDHVIIVGYGVNGRNVAKAAKTADIPYLIIEMNPEIVREERKW